MADKVRHLPMRGGWVAFAEAMRERAAFSGGGGPCHGCPKIPGVPMFTTGKLDEGWYESVAEADYVVYSYQTPIAWHIPGMHAWMVPETRYQNDEGKPSKTTTRHQNMIRTAAQVVAAEEQQAADYIAGV